MSYAVEQRFGYYRQRRLVLGDLGQTGADGTLEFMAPAADSTLNCR